MSTLQNFSRHSDTTLKLLAELHGVNQFSCLQARTDFFTEFRAIYNGDSFIFLLGQELPHFRTSILQKYPRSSDLDFRTSHVIYGNRAYQAHFKNLKVHPHIDLLGANTTKASIPIHSFHSTFSAHRTRHFANLLKTELKARAIIHPFINEK